MSGIADRYARIADGFAVRLDAVPQDRWQAQSPCEKWTARDVVVHLIHEHRRLNATATDLQTRLLCFLGRQP